MPGLTRFASRHQDALFAAVLALLVWMLGAHALDRFWRGDDTHVLLHTLKYPLHEIFLIPAVWQELSTANLTPWISLSFRLDYLLAGIDPRVFYLHQLLTLWLVAVVATHLFTLVSDKWLARTGAVLFLLGLPVLHVGGQLYTRHYLEGLLFCLLAVVCFLRYQRDHSLRYELLALACYVAAMTAKEVYVPLGLLFVLLARGDRRQRAREALPHIVALGLYLAWRGYMLAGHVGGYAAGSTYLDGAFWADVVVSFAALPTLLFGGFALFIAPVLGAVVIAGLLLQPARLPLALALCAFVFGPLVPLVAYPGITEAHRYLLLPWFLLCFALTVQAPPILQRAATVRPGAWPTAIAALACASIALCLLDHRTQVRDNELAYHTAFDVQARHVWNHDASTAFLPDASVVTSIGMMRALGEIKQLFDPAASIPYAALDLMKVDTQLPLYAYSEDCRCMRDISATITAQRDALQRQLRKAPLELTIRNRDGWIDWDFGPYENGAYNVVSSFVGNLALPRHQSGLRTNIRRPIEFYLRYTAPEGWVTYSPLMHLSPDGKVLAWHRE